MSDAKPSAGKAIRMTAYEIREAYEDGELGVGDEFVDAPAHDALAATLAQAERERDTYKRQCVVEAGVAMQLDADNDRLEAELAQAETLNKAIGLAEAQNNARMMAAEAALAQAQSRLAELAAQRPATLKQRVEELESALRKIANSCTSMDDAWARDMAMAALRARTEATWMPADRQCDCEIGFCRKQNLSAQEHCRVDRLNYQSNRSAKP